MTLRLYFWLITTVIICGIFLHPQYAEISMYVLLVIGFNMSWRDISQKATQVEAVLLIALILATLVETQLQWSMI